MPMLGLEKVGIYSDLGIENVQQEEYTIPHHNMSGNLTIAETRAHCVLSIDRTHTTMLAP